MYTIEYFPQKDIDRIEEEWRKLEKGSEMTYFQRYDWYKMLIPFTPSVKFYTDSFYAVVRKDGKAVLIAPLWVLTHNYLFVNKRGIYLIGRRGCTDYMNFIYETFDPDSISFLLTQLAKKYGQNTLTIEGIKEDTNTFQYLKTQHCAITVSSEVCVSLSIPDRIEDYQKMLSKSSRQNIRTAVNRSEKDGLRFDYYFDDISISKSRCSDIRTKRLAKKANNGSGTILSRLKSAIYRSLEVRFPICLPHESDIQSHYLSAYLNDELQMYFCYGMDQTAKRLVVMTAGLDDKYARYSLGMVAWYNYILQLINDKQITEIDFLRGGERYKYALGGTESSISTIKVAINE